MYKRQGLAFVQIGGVVSVGGKIKPAGDLGSWFTIPNSIGAPATFISGNINTGLGNREDINYGISWECPAESRTIKVIHQYAPEHQGSEVGFHCTYVTKQKPANASEYL